MLIVLSRMQKNHSLRSPILLCDPQLLPKGGLSSKAPSKFQVHFFLLLQPLPLLFLYFLPGLLLTASLPDALQKRENQHHALCPRESSEAAHLRQIALLILYAFVPLPFYLDRAAGQSSV